MAGDPLRNAFRAELDSIISTAAPPIAWVRKDTLNTSEQPDASTGYVDREFPGGGEEQYTFGAPAANLHREEGQVTVRVVTPLRGGQVERDKAEAYAEQIRAAFPMRRFAAGSRSRITVALAYEIYNVG